MNAQIRSPKGGNKLASIFHLGRAASNFHFNPDRGYTAVEDSVVFKLGYATKVINPGDPILMPRSHYEHLKDIVRRS